MVKADARTIDLVFRMCMKKLLWGKNYIDRVEVRQKRCKTGAELMPQLRDGPKAVTGEPKTDALPDTMSPGRSFSLSYEKSIVV
jgi:hypothetical protein